MKLTKKQRKELGFEKFSACYICETPKLNIWWEKRSGYIGILSGGTEISDFTLQLSENTSFDNLEKFINHLKS